MKRIVNFTSRASHSTVRRRMTIWALIAIAAASIKLASVVTAAPATINGIILLVGADESERRHAPRLVHRQDRSGEQDHQAANRVDDELDLKSAHIGHRAVSSVPQSLPRG
jgi:hypothetical protein